MPFADVDAVTVDGYGTLVTLKDPVPALSKALREWGVERDGGRVAAAFAAEAAYYRPRSLEGRDERSLADLQVRCAAVFLEALDSDVSPRDFAPSFVAALEFEPLDGVTGALTALARRGISLAVVSNWDCALPDHLQRVGLRRFFADVTTSASAGAAKPSAAIFAAALDRVGVAAARAVHVGDGEADRLGAERAGIRFARAPLAAAFAGW
jgi:HAD superfamily hydrolase (TIGR01509 family)